MEVAPRYKLLTLLTLLTWLTLLTLLTLFTWFTLSTLFILLKRSEYGSSCRHRTCEKDYVITFVSLCYLNQNILVFRVSIIDLLGHGQHSKIFTENG